MYIGMEVLRLYRIAKMNIDLNSQFVAGAAGAIIGAVVGGAISFLLQWYGNSRDQRLKEAERREKRKERAQTLLVRMIAIFSHISNLTQYAEEANEKRNTPLGLVEPWQTYLPIATMPPSIEFTAEEMSLLFSLKNDDLFNDMIVYDQVYRNTLDLFARMNNLKTRLMDELPVNFDEKHHGLTVLELDEFRTFRTQMILFNDIFEQTIHWCRKEKKISSNMVVELHKTLAKETGITMSLEGGGISSNPKGTA
jgi:hypothetical protein